MFLGRVLFFFFFVFSVLILSLIYIIQKCITQDMQEEDSWVTLCLYDFPSSCLLPKIWKGTLQSTMDIGRERKKSLNPELGGNLFKFFHVFSFLLKVPAAKKVFSMVERIS